jgi:hypothetical protein
MPSETPSLSEFIGQLPRRLQVHFESHARFVSGVIEEEKAKLNSSTVLSLEDVQLIQLAVFVYSCDGFFRTGAYTSPRRKLKSPQA